MSKTTAKHFEIYKKECEKWIDVFGLKGWEPYFEHDIKDENALAQMFADIEGRTCTFFLAPDWGGNPVTNEELDKTAFHEVLELLLARLNFLANSRSVNQSEIVEEIHHIIRTFENAVFKIFKKK